jgi:hypothetical protein
MGPEQAFEAIGAAIATLPTEADRAAYSMALFGKAGRFCEDIVKRTRNFFATGIGHDTKRAVLGTAFHDGDEGRTAFDARGWQGIEFFDFGKADIHLRAPLLFLLAQQLGQPRLQKKAQRPQLTRC